MIAELKPYPVMKDSGVAWLGEIRADILALEQDTEGLFGRDRRATGP